MITTTTTTIQKPAKLSWAEKRALAETGQAAPTVEVEETVTTITGTIDAMVQEGGRFTYTIDGDTVRAYHPLYIGDMVVAGEGDTVTATIVQDEQGWTATR